MPRIRLRSHLTMIRAALCLFSSFVILHSSFAAPPNLLIITTDDMSCDSVGVYGCKLPDTTPNMDRLAAQSLRFNHAHVVVGNCMPSRNVMWSGRYPHNNRIQGFRAMSKNDKDYPVLGDLMKEAGYFTAIRHKVSHSTPYSPFPWDLVLGNEKKDDVKNAASWGEAATKGIEAARKAGKPFCLMLNIADPHKPFYAEGKGGATVPDDNVPTRVFTPEEVPVPGFLHDDPVIRKELAHYYSSVRRADDSVGEILDALKASGADDSTVIVFLSDHGMPLPFAKTQLYHHSTRTPLMVRWNGVTKAGSVDGTNMVSAVDLLPTLLDIVGVEHPPGFDGRSFAPLLKGEPQADRGMVFKSYDENSGGQRTPMRAVQTRDYVYLFNPWSNGTRVMSGATAGTSTCHQMRVLAKTNEQIAARIDLFDHRVPEEAYEVSYDPDALTNLIDRPEHAQKVADLEKAMEEWMVRVKDPLLDIFRHRDDAAYRENWMMEIEKERTERRKKAKAAPNAKGNAAAKKSAAKSAELIQLVLPEIVTAGQPAIAKVTYNFPADLGEKPIQITLKDGGNGRIKRETRKAGGSGALEVSFDIPAEVPGGKVSFAGLVGEGIKDALQHIQTKPVAVKTN